MKLAGNRLDLQPLTAAELSLATENYAGLKQALDLNAGGASLDEEMQYAMRIRHSRVQQDEENYLWLTNWAIIQRRHQQIIGYIILKDCPNEQGEVIIGYCIDEWHWGKGYATEAVRTISEWIFSDPRAQWIIADTEKDNWASHKVLEHLGAHMYRDTGDLFWWRIARPTNPVSSIS